MGIKPNINISVIVCTYNGAKYVDEQIETILKQDYPASQIVICDDCSTDNTWELLLKWQTLHPDTIELYRHASNKGFNDNFAFALSKVKGEYVAICDQDDVWFPRKLSTLAQYASNNPNVTLFHHSEAILGQNEGANNHTYWKPYEGSGCGILFVLNRLTGHLLFFKSSLLDDILPIPTNVIYDWWINVVVAVNGVTMFVPEKLMAYRNHGDSAYFSNVEKQLSDVTKPVLIALEAFSTLVNIKPKDRHYLHRLLELYKKHKSNQFDLVLFLFFLKNRYSLFKDYVVAGSKIYREIFLIRLCRAFSKW